jgi:hypothetical protein
MVQNMVRHIFIAVNIEYMAPTLANNMFQAIPENTKTRVSLFENAGFLFL